MDGYRKRKSLPPQWQVTTAATTPAGDLLYRVVHIRSLKTVYVTSPLQGEARDYAWDGRHMDPVPLAVRQEIDRALIRYLMEAD